MKISVKVRPGAKIDAVEELEDGSFLVSVKALPIDGRANGAVIEVLAEFLKIPKSNLRILSGMRSKRKIIEILDQ